MAVRYIDPHMNSEAPFRHEDSLYRMRFLHGSIELFKGKLLSQYGKNCTITFWDMKSIRPPSTWKIIDSEDVWTNISKSYRTVFPIYGSNASPWTALSIHEKKLFCREPILHAEIEGRKSLSAFSSMVYLWITISLPVALLFSKFRL